MALSTSDINRLWTHKHPSRPHTDMRGYQVSTYEEVADLRADVVDLRAKLDHTHALVEQINRVIVLGGWRP